LKSLKSLNVWRVPRSAFRVVGFGLFCGWNTCCRRTTIHSWREVNVNWRSFFFFLILKVFNVECCNNISPHYLNYKVTNLIYRLKKHCFSRKCKHNVTLYRKCKGKIIYHKCGIQYALFLVLQVHFSSSIFVFYKNYLKEVKDYYWIQHFLLNNKNAKSNFQMEIWICIASCRYDLEIKLLYLLKIMKRLKGLKSLKSLKVPRSVFCVPRCW